MTNGKFAAFQNSVEFFLYFYELDQDLQMTFVRKTAELSGKTMKNLNDFYKAENFLWSK
jgi:hypothetical protein